MANITSFVYQLVVYRQNDTQEICMNLIFTTAVGLIKELDRFISPKYPKDKKPTDTSLTNLKEKYVLNLYDENFIFEIRKLNFHPSKSGLIDFFNKHSVLRPLVF